jgi:DNA-binding FadR family transcriptional regulator
VPPERELAQTMDLSGNKVREANKFQASTIKHGHGVFVTDTVQEPWTESIRIPGRASQSLSDHKKILKAIVNQDMDSAVQFMLEYGFTI